MNGAACGKGRRLFLVRIPGKLLRTQPSDKTDVDRFSLAESGRVRRSPSLPHFPPMAVSASEQQRHGPRSGSC